MSLDSQSPPPEDIAVTASNWLARRDRGFTPAEQDEYLQWLQSDSANGRAVARLELAWAELDLLAEWRPEHSTTPNPDLLARSNRKRAIHWLTAATLAAAAIVVAFLAFRDRPMPIHAPMAVVAADYERRVLEDGSIVELRGGAAIELSYTSTERRVRLVRGEALFTVEKNPSRPFIVRAGTVDVRAVGTVFNVRLEKETIEVLVTEGRVRLDESVQPSTYSRQSASPMLEAGQRAVVAQSADVAQATSIATASPGEIARTLAWQPRRLEFNAAPLARVIADFNAHNKRQLRLADPSLAPLPIGGNFRSDNLDAFVRMLGASFDIDAAFAGDEIVLHPKRR